MKRTLYQDKLLGRLLKETGAVFIANFALKYYHKYNNENDVVKSNYFKCSYTPNDEGKYKKNEKNQVCNRFF
jgi:hypothetical protein